MTLESLATPALLLDRNRMSANVARMDAALAGRGVDLRPHLKTCKSAEVARAMTRGWSGAVTVSTLKEAEQFLAAGYRDILYAVGIAPARLPQVEALIRNGAQLSIILDNLDAARAVAAHAKASGVPFAVLVEIDCDGHRAGVRPDDTELLVAIGRTLDDAGADLRGVMTHGGGSYGAATAEALAAHAELERSATVRAATSLRGAGLPCPVVSVGSTPTALFTRDLAGVTEVRAGVYVFFDLVMAGLGVCTTGDVALSVLTRVIGHQRERGWVIVDAGWMAMSRDRGTAGQAVDQGYGLACDEGGRPLGDLVVVSANQEHGIVAHRSGGPVDVARFPVGTLLRILPNHACATAAQHDRYHVVGEDGAIDATWPRFGGW